MGCNLPIGVADGGGSVSIDNRSSQVLIARYRDGPYLRFFEVPPNERRHLVTILGGAVGKVDLLSESCRVIVYGLELDELGQTMISFAEDETGSSDFTSDEAVAGLPGAEELFDDRCRSASHRRVLIRG